MDALNLYKIHTNSINNYLVIYSIIISLLIIIAFLIYRYSEKPFSKSLFFTLLICGLILGGSALNFRTKNSKEATGMELQHQQNPDKFLSERLQAASQYQQHFQHLLTIWVVAIAVLALLSYFLFKRKMIVGVLCGLAICCVASLLLDFTGFKADASYYAGLKKLAITKNIQLKY